MESRWRSEIEALRPLFADLPGDLGVQIGGCGTPCLADAKVATVFEIDTAGTGGVIRAHAEALPLASASLDVVVLVHVMDESQGADQVLREAARVLRGEAWLIVIGLRPLSLAGLRELRLDGAGKSLPLGPWRLRALMKNNGLVWHGARRVGASYVARGLRRGACMTPMRPTWSTKVKAGPRTVRIPGAGHAG